MQADGGEAVEVCKHEGLAEDTNEEDGRHGLRGRSEVDELVRMRSKRRGRGAVARRVIGGFQPLGTNRSRRPASSLLRVGDHRLPRHSAARRQVGAGGGGLGLVIVKVEFLERHDRAVGADADEPVGQRKRLNAANLTAVAGAAHGLVDPARGVGRSAVEAEVA